MSGREPCAALPPVNPLANRDPVPCWWVGLLEGALRCAPASKPTRQQGSCALLAGGWRKAPSSTHPPAGHKIPVGGWVYWRERERKAPSTHPPTSRETPLSGVLPLCTVGTFQLPRSQKQTPSSLPPHSMFLTAVTAMGGASIPGEFNTFVHD